MIDIRDRLDQAVQKTIVKTALQETNEEIVLPDILRRAPIDTGQLKDLLKVTAKSGRGKLGSAIMDNPYKGDEFYASFNELGTKHQPARSFMRPAIDENEAAILNSIGTKIAKGIAEATK
jgi:HK97 gp10 family phage protein